MLRTINNLIRTLLFQAHIPPSYWVEALNMAAHLLNRLPSTAINNEIPFTKLYNQTPTYEDLRVFGCLCYPHVDASHKLEPRSTPCIFLGYPANHRGYRCLDLASNKIIISRHVRFDEDVFPFGNVTPSNTPTYDFLLPHIQTTTNVPTTEPFVQHMNEPNTPITPHHITPPTSPPQPDTHPSYSSTPIPPQPDTPPSHSSTPIPTSAPTQSHAQTVDSHTPFPINNSSQTMSTHPMVTRAKAGIFKPLERMNCHVTTTSPLPRSHVHALRDPHWKEAMLDEYNALISNGTWALVPRPANVNVVRSMWLFKHKFKADGSLSRYKARLVANGRSQQQGIDCDETFSPVVKPATIRTVLVFTFLGLCMGLSKPPVLGFSALLVMLHDIVSAFFNGSFTSLIGVRYEGSWFHSIIFLVFLPQRSATGIVFVSIQNFAEEILERAHMQNCKTCRKPYLTFTRPDLSYAVQQIHVLSATLAYLVTDVNGLGCLLLLIIDGVANVVAETAWIRNLLCELHTPLFTATLVYCDNVSAVYMSANPVQHQRTKHIEIDIHFVRDFVASGQVRVLHVPSRFQYADIFEGLPIELYSIDVFAPA
ncbi:ribonuclease H-like domain-containing protein [Tanacetum coccineum]